MELQMMIEMLLQQLPNFLPDEAWARDAMAWVTFIMTALTGLGKFLNWLVPTVRDFADHTAAKWDDKVADRVEWLAEKLAVVNSWIPHTDIGTRREDARPSMRPPKPPPTGGAGGALMGVVMFFFCALLMLGCGERRTQTTLNISGEVLYGLDEGLAPWVRSESARCHAVIDSMPDNAETDYEAIWSDCMTAPIAVSGALESSRVGLRDANRELARYRRGELDAPPCAAIEVARVALRDLLSRLDAIEDFDVPVAAVDAVAALASATCEDTIGANR